VRVTGRGNREIPLANYLHRADWLGYDARHARQPVPGRPITRARTGQSGAAGCKGEKSEEEGERVADKRGPDVSERGEKKGGGESWAAQLDDLMSLLGWAGSG
jgi:hypothetical protein